MSHVRLIPLIACLLAASSVSADAGFRGGIYQIDSHYGMPHMDENLRDVRASERRCLRDEGELGTIFPVLRDASMQGCALDRRSSDAGEVRFMLICGSSQAPTGSALLRTEPGRIGGVLRVKGGGKNMTYSQTIEAKRKGDCDPR